MLSLTRIHLAIALAMTFRLASASISSLYFPSSKSGAGLVFGNFAIGTAEWVGDSLAQEFVIGRFTKRRGHME
jgi:hypothetical protein